MKIVKMENDSIKVVLTESDLVNMNINFKGITPESPEMNSFLTKIIKAVSEETGLFIEEGKILIDAGNEDGCVVLLITKRHRSLESVRAKAFRSVKRCDRILFEIPSFDEFYMMLICVDEKILERMRIYRYKSGFYISMPRFPVPLAVCEFSKRCKKNQIAESVLSEHGTLIAKREQVVKMAREVKKIF